MRFSLVARLLPLVFLFAAGGLRAQAAGPAQPSKWRTAQTPGPGSSSAAQPVDPATLAAVNARLRQRLAKAGGMGAAPSGPASEATASTPATGVPWERLHSAVADHPPAVAQAADGSSATLDGLSVSLREGGTAGFVTLPDTGGPGVPGAPTDIALAFLRAHRGLFRLAEPGAELAAVDVHTDAQGKRHVRFGQRYEGLPVWGQDIVVHLRPDGSVYALNAHLSPTPRPVDAVVRRVPAEAAWRTAADHWQVDQDGRVDSAPSPEALRDSTEEVVWLDPKSGTPHRAWLVELRLGLLDHWRYFVDEADGAILQHYNTVASDGPATATALDLNGVSQRLDVYQTQGQYWLLDTSRSTFVRNPTDFLNSTGMLQTFDARNQILNDESLVYYVVSDDNRWPDPATVSAHANARQVFDYFFDTHGRKAIDDLGGSELSIVHVLNKDGVPMDNAFWNGVSMVYGDGRLYFHPLAAALDVAAHEMTHGVVQHTVGLEYLSQAGALNESFADCFGAMVDRDDWQMAENVIMDRVTFPNGALRDLADPHNGGSGPLDAAWQPSHMREYQDMPEDSDHGGVHMNSGIPNHACYLISEAIGRDKTEKIYYRVLDARYVNAQANFVDMRRATIFAAGELYGEGSPEATAVKNAFDAVGLFDGDGSQRDPPHGPVVGDSWIAAVNADGIDNSLYVARPVIDSPDDLVRLTETEVATDTSQPITAFGATSVLLFVDTAHNIRAIGLDGSGEQVIGDQGIWSSISASPDGLKVAVTTTARDGKLFVLDLEAQKNTEFDLYYPTLEGPSHIVKYADVLDWDAAGEHILFDCLSEMPVAGGDPVAFWSINTLDVASATIYPVLADQPLDVDIGNPAYGKSADSFIVFEYYDRAAAHDYIYGLDAFTGDVALIADNGDTIGYPDYSPDDSFIVFQRWVDNRMTLLEMPMQPSRIHSAGEAVEFVVEAQRPVWLAFGTEHGPSIPVPTATPRWLPTVAATPTGRPTTPRPTATRTPPATPTRGLPPAGQALLPYAAPGTR